MCSELSEKFKNIPKDEDTRTFLRQQMKFGEFEVVFEHWKWEGIEAESIIFVNVEVADLTDDELKEMVRESPIVNKDSGITIRRSKSGYTFVNFNFES